MKAEIVKKQLQDSQVEYPALMIGALTGVVILAYGPARGVTRRISGAVLVPGDSKYEIGYYAGDWRAESFSPFKGTIQLSN